MLSTLFMPLLIYLFMLFKFPHVPGIYLAAVHDYLLKVQTKSLSLKFKKLVYETRLI